MRVYKFRFLDCGLSDISPCILGQVKLWRAVIREAFYEDLEWFKSQQFEYICDLAFLHPQRVRSEVYKLRIAIAHEEQRKAEERANAEPPAPVGSTYTKRGVSQLDLFQ